MSDNVSTGGGRRSVLPELSSGRAYHPFTARFPLTCKISFPYTPAMPDYNLAEFLRISAVLNYMLSAKRPDWGSVTSIVLEGKAISSHDQDVLIDVFDYLSSIYGKTKRDLGPFSVLHPVRATALLSHASDKLVLLDLMTCLLHDNFEDFQPAKFKAADWIKLDNKFQSFLTKLPEDRQQQLREHLQWLTKEPAETYYHYIGRLLERACNCPEVVRVKLADRLDNTFDMRIELQDPLQGVDFFEIIFQMMFSSTYKGYRPEKPHQPTLILNGAERLYQLFKNIVLLSLIRQRRSAGGDAIGQGLFNALAKASMQEAQRIALHIFGYHETTLSTFKNILLETMAYSQSHGIDTVTRPDAKHRLDGLFMSVFDQPQRDARKKHLAQLYGDKPLMIQVAVSFVIIFLNFLNDADYFVRGISAEGIRPETVCSP